MKRKTGHEKGNKGETLLLVADDMGSKEFAPTLRNLVGSTNVCLERLTYGDFAWIGKGPEGREINVGVERKSIIDLVQSMRGGRLAGFQVPGMVETYNVRYLLLEGAFRADKDGYMEWLERGKMVRAFVGKRSVGMDEVYGFLATLRHQGMFEIVRTEGKRWQEVCGVDSCWWLKREYEWWQKPWEDHTALGTGGLGLAVVDRPQGLVKRPNLVWKWVNCIPGAGPVIAKLAAAEWETPRMMANAPEHQWERVVRGVDSGLAVKIIRQIRDGAKR